jgi:hypothetical protein
MIETGPSLWRKKTTGIKTTGIKTTKAKRTSFK